MSLLSRRSGDLTGYFFRVTNPNAAQFIQYVNTRALSIDPDDLGDADAGAAGDLGPEGLAFISGAQSPIPGVPLLAVSNEISGTTTLYRIDTVELSAD